MRKQPLKTLKSELKDRNLRFDGVSEIEPDQLARFLLLGVPPSKLRINGTEADIAEFNTQVSEYDQLLPVKPEPVNLDMSWQLPEKYQQIDLTEYMGQLFEVKLDGSQTADYIDTAINRIDHELREVQARGMVQFMQTVIYILDHLRENNIVWGVGRGSSCASYLLYLIGLHVVDCVAMDVAPDEFFHD